MSVQCTTADDETWVELNVVGKQVVRTKARQLVAKRTPPNAVARRVAELTASLPNCMVRHARGYLTG
jgi:hypothetical protein